MATIRDVAERAGVAPITVSRVLNNSGYVSQETRERVESAAAELEYVPNMLARSLRSNRTDTFALVLTDITNPFWTTVARGVEDAASEHGFNVILCNTDEQVSKQERYLSVLLRKQVDGFLFVPARSRTESLDMIRKQAVPVVVLDRHIPNVDVDTVRCNSERGSYRLLRHLLELGHRRIAILAGPQDVSTSQDRILGYRNALIEAGIEIDDRLIECNEYTAESGYLMAHRVLSLRPRPTALFAANNFIAVGALRALRELGLQVPQDISIVGFDDLPPYYIIEPFLTVAVQPAYTMGYKAATLLIERITQPVHDGFQELLLSSEIKIRRSTQAISNGAG